MLQFSSRIPPTLIPISTTNSWLGSPPEPLSKVYRRISKVIHPYWITYSIRIHSWTDIIIMILGMDYFLQFNSIAVQSFLKLMPFNRNLSQTNDTFSPSPPSQIWTTFRNRKCNEHNGTSWQYIFPALSYKSITGQNGMYTNISIFNINCVL